MVPAVVVPAVVAIWRAKKPRMRINPNPNDNHRDNNKCHIFKTKHTRWASFHHSNNAKRVRVSIIIGPYLFFVLLLGILLGASRSSESLEHICNALDTTTSGNLFHESLR